MFILVNSKVFFLQGSFLYMFIMKKTNPWVFFFWKIQLFDRKGGRGHYSTQKMTTVIILRGSSFFFTPDAHSLSTWPSKSTQSMNYTTHINEFINIKFKERRALAEFKHLINPSFSLNFIWPRLYLTDIPIKYVPIIQFF